MFRSNPRNVMQTNIFTKVASMQIILCLLQLPMIANNRKLVKKFLAQSLKNLKLSYVDLYLIHFPVGFVYHSPEEYFPKKDGIVQLDFSTDILEVWKAMEAQVDSNRTRFIGLSNFNREQISRILKVARIPPVNLQVGNFLSFL